MRDGADTDDTNELSRAERLELEDEGYVVSHPDHDDAQRIAVADWDHVMIRTTGTDGAINADGLDFELETIATDGSVAELLVKGEVVARLVHVDDGNPALENGGHDETERVPPGIREQFEYDPVYCTDCEIPVSVTIKDDPQPFRWECSCAVGYPTATLPDQWIDPESDLQ